MDTPEEAGAANERPSVLVSLDDGEMFAFTDSLSIGRHPRNDLQIDHPRVSGRHASIEWDGERWRIRDLGSSNGTTVDGKKCQGWLPLREGLVLRFAAVSRWRIERLRPPPTPTRFGRTQRDEREPGILDLHLFLKLVGMDEGEIRIVHDGGEWVLFTGQRFLLLYILGRAGGEWVRDDDLRVGLWGRAGKHDFDPSALHKLIHDTRKLLIEQGFDGWLVEKARGRTRLKLPADRIHVIDG